MLRVFIVIDACNKHENKEIDKGIKKIERERKVPIHPASYL